MGLCGIMVWFDGSGWQCWTQGALQYLRGIPAKLFESLAASIRTGDLVIVVLLESVVSGQGKV